MLAAQLADERTKNNSAELTRRSFLKVLGTSAVGLALPGTSHSARKKTRPNILFIMVDDLGKEWISCYGAEDSPREWIMALGHGAARLDEKGVRGKVDYTERVIRDKRYKVWVSEQREISQLYDLRRDPFEENNLIASTRPEHLAAIKKFQAVVDSMPEKDGRPLYKPRKPNPWDKKLPSGG